MRVPEAPAPPRPVCTAHERPAAGVECVQLAGPYLVHVETCGPGSSFHILARFNGGLAIGMDAPHRPGLA